MHLIIWCPNNTHTFHLSRLDHFGVSVQNVVHLYPTTIIRGEKNVKINDETSIEWDDLDAIQFWKCFSLHLEQWNPIQSILLRCVVGNVLIFVILIWFFPLPHAHCIILTMHIKPNVGGIKMIVNLNRLEMITIHRLARHTQVCCCIRKEKMSWFLFDWARW